MLININTMYWNNIYFDVIRHEPMNDDYKSDHKFGAHNGEVLISLNKIHLKDKHQNFIADIKEIKNIETSLPNKLLVIHFWDYDIVMSSQKDSHLKTLSETLSLSHNHLIVRDYMALGAQVNNM